ncbi:MAG: FAD-dependent oxidoreductase [Pseudonocardia sp.]
MTGTTTATVAAAVRRRIADPAAQPAVARPAGPMSTPERVLVVGGDAAGMSAASRIARHGCGSRVTVLERAAVVSYAACGMPYHLDGRIPDARTLLVRSPQEFAALGIEVRLNHEVTAVDPVARTATVRSDGVDRVLGYDALLLATGARACLPPLPGRAADGVYTFRTYADMIRLADRLDRDRPRRIVLVGGGYIGVELAEVLRCAGVAVTLVEAGPTLLGTTLDPGPAAVVAEELAGRGIEVRLGEQVGGIHTRAGAVSGVATSSGDVACDAVVVAVGAAPNADLAEAAGLALDERSGAVLTGEDLRSSRDGVWAAGDCAATVDLVSGQRTWVPLGPTANKQGRIAGDSILGLPARFAGVAGTALVKAFDLEIGRTGLTAAAAAAAGFDPVCATVESTDRAHYYPGARPTRVLLVADRSTGRLLGGQVLGRSGVAGRTNVLATALYARLGVEDLLDLDLGYAPPFAPVWDPVLVAAGQVRRRIRETG